MNTANPSIRAGRVIAAGYSTQPQPMVPQVPGANMQAPKNDKQGPSKKMKLIVLILLLLVALLVALLLMQSCSGDDIQQSNSGVELVDTNGMTDEEAQAYIDEKAREGMMNVSFAETMKLSGSNFYIGFTNSADNKQNQALTLSQGGEVIFTTHPLEPGYQVATLQLPDTAIEKLQAGEAQVSVSYVNSDAEPVGNAAMFPVQVVIES